MPERMPEEYHITMDQNPLHLSLRVLAQKKEELKQVKTRLRELEEETTALVLLVEILRKQADEK